MLSDMRLITSFTGARGVRYPAPDVARGFMLLLIAVANVPQWSKAPAESASTFQASAADTWWVFVRTLFVDHRAYPLFAMLFGFGLMTMINRRTASGTRAYLQSLPGWMRGVSRRRRSRPGPVSRPPWTPAAWCGAGGCG